MLDGTVKKLARSIRDATCEDEAYLDKEDLIEDLIKYLKRSVPKFDEVRFRKTAYKG